MERYTRRFYNPQTRQIETRMLINPQRKVYLRALLAEILELSPTHISRRFAPGYNIKEIRAYLASRGYKKLRKAR